MYFKSKKDIAEILDKLKSFVTVENGEGTVQDVIDAIEKLQADQETLQDVINDIIGESGGGEGETLAGLHTELDGIKANQTNGEQEMKQVGSIVQYEEILANANEVVETGSGFETDTFYDVGGSKMIISLRLANEREFSVRILSRTDNGDVASNRDIDQINESRYIISTDIVPKNFSLLIMNEDENNLEIEFLTMKVTA